MNQYRVEGMTCSACSAHVEKAVRKLPFVKTVQVSLLTNGMTVETKDGQSHSAEIEAAVQNAGYSARMEGEKEEKTVGQAPKDPLLKRFVWSLALLLPLMYVSMQHMAGWPIPAVLNGHHYPLVNALTQMLLTIPILLINDAFFRSGFRKLWKLSPNMDSLIAVGSGAAFAYGVVVVFRMAIAYGDGNPELAREGAMELYFESAAMILTLITLGKMLEGRAKRKTTSEIEKLMALTPDTVTVVTETGERIVPTADVRAQDVLQIHPGERIPVDGVLLEGQITVDQSHITGESIPVEKQAGDTLVAGSMNPVSSFRMRATKVGEDTTLAQIVHLVREAGDSKAPIAKVADRVSGIFVPVVIGIAAVTLAVWLIAGQSFGFAFSRAISVLVISCPCALGLATPVAIMVGTGVGAKHGILFRNGEVLETLHHTTGIVLDKTGTLTEGKMSVQEVIPAPGIQREAFVRAALSLEKTSEHPVAAAVVAYAEKQGLSPDQARNFLSHPGKGVSAEIDGETYRAGTALWMQEEEIDLSLLQSPLRAIQEKGYSVLCFAKNRQALGLIGVSDTLKSGAKEAVASLKALGVTPYMLTGDQRRAAAHIAGECGVENVLAEVLPQDKAGKVKQLQQEGLTVTMVGDGINDAPALKQADIGMAIGGGTDIAIETADVVLAGNRLTDIPTAIELSRAVIRNIRENLFWAFFYNVVGIPVAAGVLYPWLGITLNPMIGAAAMSLSSVCVVSNALRLKRFKTPESLAIQPRAQQPERKEINMKKTIHVEGMSCNHCKMSVEKALSALPQVEKAEVSLEKKIAVVTLNAEVSDALLSQTVTEEGFEVKGID